MSAPAIQVESIEGVITDLVFNLPEGEGGVIVLRGTNGIGKTTALRVIEGLLAGSGRFRPSDGATGGKAQGFGRKLSVTSKTRYSGAADVATLDSRLNIADLVYPVAKTPEAREKIRIKALITLSGAPADPSLFHELAGGKERFDEIVPEADQSTDDPTELAARVHRALHAEARRIESEAEREKGHAAAYREKLSGLDMDEVHDAERLEQAVENALRREQSLLEQRRQATEAAERHQKAAAALAEAEGNHTGLSLTDAELVASEATLAWDDAITERDRLRKLLEDAERTVEQKKQAAHHADETLSQVRRHTDTVAAWKQTLQEPIPAEPAGEELAAAEQAVREARAARDRGVLIREALQDKAKAEAAEAKHDELAKEAEHLREQARRTDEVLSKAIPHGPLWVKDGALHLDSPVRGKNVPFEGESDGLRWRVAIPYVAQAVGAGGAFVAMQDAWQHLGRELRAEVARQCVEEQVWMFTAEITEGELRAERFDAEAGEYHVLGKG